jgi:hypothetical protein
MISHSSYRVVDTEGSKEHSRAASISTPHGKEELEMEI